jgi:hypothetical protein
LPSGLTSRDIQVASEVEKAIVRSGSSGNSLVAFFIESVFCMVSCARSDLPGTNNRDNTNRKLIERIIRRVF